MKTITIGTAPPREFRDATGGWIHDQVAALLSRGLSVCVRVQIKTDSVNVAFATPGCGPTQSADREPNPEEQKLVDLWRRRGLNNADFEIGQLVAFIDEAKHL